MEALVEKLLMRRSRIRELIEAFAISDRRPFPQWGTAGAEVGAERWNPEHERSSMRGRPN
jgi:hypothetical protein